MDQIFAWILLVAACAWAAWLLLERADLKSSLRIAQQDAKGYRETAELWQKKYDDLVEDVKKVAMRPQIVAPAEPEKPRKARSSGEIRRMFDAHNAKVLAEKDQAAG